MRVVALLATVPGVACDLHLKHRGQGFLAADLQPDVVAHTLLSVEDQWLAQAAESARSNSTVSSGAFQKSCSTVVTAIVQASSGDRKRVKEYMDTVCSQTQLQGWHQNRCQDLAVAVAGAMVYDQGGNREYVSSASVCTNFWSHFIVEEKTRAEQERVDAADHAKDEESKRLQAEQEAAAIAADEKRRQETEDAEKKKEEAKQQAEEAAAQLAIKKAEAERQAAEAKQQLEEAQKVAEEAAKRHKEAVEKALAAANATRNFTTQHNITVNISNRTIPTNANSSATNVSSNATKATSNATK